MNLYSLYMVKYMLGQKKLESICIKILMPGEQDSITTKRS
jgi:hypothetical protein